jgi:outer membrane protein assembly factor BamB
MVNMDGYAYVAFAESDWTLRAADCTPGQTVEAKDVTFLRDDKLVLWQIHPEGSFQATVVENFKTKQPLSSPISLAWPTGALVTDNMNGTLIPVRVSQADPSSNTTSAADEFVYRVSQDRELVFRFPLPKYSGPLQDEMVIGENNVAFATRGNLLVAFNLISGKQLWRWESSESDVSVFAALANGACLVQTPTGLVEVASSTRAKQVLKGKAMMGWQGQMYLKHN